MTGVDGEAGTRSVTIRISDELVAAYDRLSGSPRSRSLVMRRALESYLQAQRDAANTAAALASAGDEEADPLLDALAHLLDAVRYRRDGAKPAPFEQSLHDAWFVLSKLHQQGYAVHRYDTSPIGWSAV